MPDGMGLKELWGKEGIMGKFISKEIPHVKTTKKNQPPTGSQKKRNGWHNVITSIKDLFAERNNCFRIIPSV